MLVFRKIILSAAVLAVFIIYSFHQRHEAAQATVLAPATANGPAPSAPSIPITDDSNQSENGQSTKPTITSTPKITTPAKYKDGNFTGQPGDAYYGLIQVRVAINGGKITDVVFLSHPNDNPTSQYINQQAMPYLKQEAIQAQSAPVNIISGATDTSMAFNQSLQSALSQAKP